jgi:hypothetical protein
LTERCAIVSRASFHWVDPFVGARTELALSERTSLVSKFSPRWTLALGYRALDQDFDHGSFEYDVLTSGPLVGVAFR